MKHMEWKATQWSGGKTYRAGWYVYRRENGRNVWLKTDDGRLIRFDSEAAAKVGSSEYTG